jgi:multicomponent K+:H+ antiporter subunit G
MNGAAEIHPFVVILTGGLLIGGAGVTLVGTLGLLRLSSFFERAHAPTLGTTLGTTCVAMASIVYFSALGTRPVLHELLIVLFVTLTTPITLMILVRAALFRERSENNAVLPDTRENDR